MRRAAAVVAALLAALVLGACCGESEDQFMDGVARSAIRTADKAYRVCLRNLPMNDVEAVRREVRGEPDHVLSHGFPRFRRADAWAKELLQTELPAGNLQV